MLKRNPDKHDKCEIMILGDFGKFDDRFDLDKVLSEAKIHNFQLIGYESDDAIKVEMLAPTELK